MPLNAHSCFAFEFVPSRTRRARERNNKLSEKDQNNTAAAIGLTGDLVAAYVSNNHIAAADLPALIATIHAAVTNLGTSGSNSEPITLSAEKVTSAQVRKSIGPEFLISFIDGKSYKTLKRHLTAHGLTPDGYRERFGLPSDYPLVAASYSEKRSSLAKSIGLGQSHKHSA